MNNVLSKKIGILGGGQLGRMLLQEAYNLNLNVAVLDPSSDAPCHQIAPEFVLGDFKDFETVLEFGKSCDIVTIEFEDVNSDALEQLEILGIEVYPQPGILKIIQDKGLQKEFFSRHNIPTGKYLLASGKNDLSKNHPEFPFFLKLRKGGYDGYGVRLIKNADDIHSAFDGELLAEYAVDIDKEISVIVSRNKSGKTSVYPAVAMQFNPVANMVEFLFSPANIGEETEAQAERLALDVIENLGMVGILAVEMFLTKNGELLVNEIAPRPHNSGHHSIEGNYTSQFASHLRAILDLPPGETASRCASAMVNILGEPGYSGLAVYEGIEQVLSIPGVYVHLYGKTHTKPYRKMGHVTITGSDSEEVETKALEVKKLLKCKA